MSRGSILVTCLAATVALLTSCLGGASLQGTNTRWDEDVPAELRAELDALDARAAAAVRAGDADALLALVPERYRASWGTPEALSSSFEPVRGAAIGSPSPTWHVVLGTFSSATGMNTMLGPRVITEPKAFMVFADAVRDRAAVTFRRADFRGGEILLAATWVPDGDGWGLYALRFGSFSLGGKDALDWFDEFERFRRDGKPIAAAVRGILLKQMLRPVPTMQYVRQQEIVPQLQAFDAEMAGRYTWPIALPGQGPSASIFRLEPLVVAEDRSFNVVVAYLSSSVTRPDAAMSAEAAALHPRALALFPDLCAGAKTIVYRAYEEMPTDPKKTYRYFGTPIPCAAP